MERFNEKATADAEAARRTTATGDLHLACEEGANVWPGYHVIRAPKVGDPVSMAFNGDSYPSGEIVKISDSLRRIETSTGLVFWRRRNSGAWINNGTWSMIRGHVFKQNPSF